MAENDILDEHTLDLYTPPGGNVLDDLADGLGKLFPTLNNVLEDARAHDVAQCSLRPLNQGLADVGDSKGGLVGADNMVVDDGRQVERDVVLGHADLLGDLDDLDLDVDLNEALGEGVDLDKARVDSLVEFAKLGDQTNVTLVHVLVRVRADDAAWNGTQGSNKGTKTVD